MVLALMRLYTVISSFDKIQDDAFKSHGLLMKALLTFFEDQWMKDISLWNVSTSDVRTNNNCEDSKIIDSFKEFFLVFLLKVIITG